MRKVKIITDSTADLTSDVLNERDIDMVPLHIILGDKTFDDDKSLSSEDLFKYADENNTLPKTAAANEYQFAEAFKKWLSQDYDIVFIGISSKLSATVQGALAALEAFDKDRISVIDSMSLSTGIAILVLEASDMAQQGAGIKEITDKIMAMRSKVSASFVVDTLKYLHMGGRCSRLTSIVGSRLQIKPMLEVVDGEIIPAAKFRGSQYVNKYVDQVMAKADQIDPKRIFITHCFSRYADDVKKRLEDAFGFKNVIITDASPTISTHCGPGTLGIIFMYK